MLSFRLPVLAKTFVLATAMIASLLGPFSAPAFAGHWVVSYQCDGQDAFFYDDQDHQDMPGPYNFTWAYIYSTEANNTGPFSDPEYSGQGGIIQSANCSGFVNATLTWTPDNPSDASPPPTEVFVQETSTAAGHKEGRDGIPEDDPASVSANNGLGDAGQGDDIGMVSSGSHLRYIDNSNGQTSISLPDCNISASGGYAISVYSTTINYTVVEDKNPPKSVMIDGGFQTYAGGEWQGKEDTRFSNDEYAGGGDGETVYKIGGDDFGPLTWGGTLIGGPWPAFAFYQAGMFNRQWEWQGGSNSDSGGTYDIHSFQTDRPHVDWPFAPANGDPPRDLLEQMDSPRVPPTQQQLINLTLTDSDQSNQHPEWNFGGGASYQVTFHNEYELIHADPSTTIPTSENPWLIMTFDGGDIETPGEYDNWSPSIYYSLDVNYGFTINGVFFGATASGSRGQGLYKNPPPTTVPPGKHGFVYQHQYKIRIPFTYKHYLVNGQEIHNDADGNEIPLAGYVDRPVGGFGTFDFDTRIFLIDDGQPAPPSFATDDNP